MQEDPASPANRRWLPWGVRAAIAALAALVVVPVAITGFWADSHEKARYAILLELFRQSVAHGNAYPRWLPDLYGGYGYGLFNFYQPGFFFAALPFSVLGNKPPYGMYLTVWLLLAVGAAGAYRLGALVARRVAGSSAPIIATGLFTATFFLLTPYLWVDLYVRGDLSEFMGVCLGPWPLYALLRLADRTERGLPTTGTVLLAAVSLAAVVLAHPIVAMFLLPCFCALAALLAWGPRWRPLALRAGAALALGFLLSSIYWWPLATLRSQVALERATIGYYESWRHVVYPQQFFWRSWGFGGSDQGLHDGMPFQLGPPHFLLATAGLYLGRKHRPIVIGYALYLALVVLMTPAGLWLWRNVGLFKLVQFPWRLLSVTAALQVLCLGGVVGLAALRGRRVFLGALAAALLVTLVWQAPQFRIKQPIDIDHWVTARVKTSPRATMDALANMNEFLPKTAPLDTKLLPRGQTRPIVEATAPAAVAFLPDASNYHIHARVESAVPATVTINQLFFPGWRVWLDGDRVTDARLRETIDSDGRMTVAVAPGAHDLRARYDGPPGWRVRVALIVAALLLVAIVWWRERAAHRARA